MEKKGSLYRDGGSIIYVCQRRKLTLLKFAENFHGIQAAFRSHIFVDLSHGGLSPYINS